MSVTVRETKKSWIVESDGYCEGYKAFVQGNAVYKIACDKAKITREQIDYYIEMGPISIGELIYIDGYSDLERRPGVRVLVMRHIQ